MAVYEVFSLPISYRYRSTICSKATVVLIVTTALTVFLPFIVSYRSNGFWLKTDTFQEQPDVRFKRDYLLVLETGLEYKPIFCGTDVTDKFLKHCSIKSREDDYNRDGRVDQFNVDIEVPLHTNESVYSFAAILPVDFRLDSVCKLQMEALIIIQYNAAQSGNGAHVVANLQFVQRKPLRYRTPEVVNGIFTSYNHIGLRKLLFNYALRNFTTSLSNQYVIWERGASENRFLLSISVSYPLNTILYRPGFWQVIKWAWMQYFSVLMVFVYLFQILKQYIYNNQLVSTRVEIPWKKFQ